MTRAVRLFHEKAPGQDRLVFLGPDDELLEIWFDALHRPNLMGSVHQARIDRVFASQNRAMASLKNGELISLRLRKNDRRLVIVGAILPVTIVAAPRHGKPWQALVGARLVTDKMVLLIGEVEQADTIKLSSRINANQRQHLIERLKVETGPVLPHGYGIILRRNGVNLSDFGAEVTGLLKMWQAGTKTLAEDKLGLIFEAGDLLTRARRLVGNLPVINDPVLANDLSITLDDVVAEGMLAKCQLACGGHLWCEQSQAIWSIDLDGNGMDDLDRLCSEAANEIPRQIRLRGMSGPVLIDVPRLPRGLAKRFLTKLQDALDDDPRRPQYLGLTRGGLIELRVPHGEMALNDVMQDQPAQDALSGLRFAMQRPGFHTVTLAVSPAMSSWLEGIGKLARDQLDKPLKLSVWPDEETGQIVRILDG
ncbi:ribonuclease E/G [Candidatus Puniceispirillum sp.]|nr:ribonuclease E/G [Candidatus Puniceispirillum sp.]